MILVFGGAFNGKLGFVNVLRYVTVRQNIYQYLIWVWKQKKAKNLTIILHKIIYRFCHDLVLELT